MILVLIGPPGSGKGTQSSYISSTLKLPAFSVGDLLRKAALEDEQKIGAEISSYIDAGKLVPEELVNKAIGNIINSTSCSAGCILDGFPRTINQAEFLSGAADKVLAIYFKIDQNLLVKRIVGRYNCQECGKIYNKFFLKPVIENICDYCGSNKFSCRSDDNEQTISARLKTYEEATEPVVKYYQDKELLRAIDAAQDRSAIENQLHDILKNV